MNVFFDGWRHSLAAASLAALLGPLAHGNAALAQHEPAPVSAAAEGEPGADKHRDEREKKEHGERDRTEREEHKERQPEREAAHRHAELRERAATIRRELHVTGTRAAAAALGRAESGDRARPPCRQA